MKTHLLSLILLLLAAPVLALTPAERAVIWTRTHNAIYDQFTGFDNQQRTTWKSEFDSALQELLILNDETEFWRALRVKIAALNDGRTGIQLPNGLPRTYDTVPIRFVFADGKVLVKQLGNSAEVRKSGIKPGDELRSVNGTRIADHIRNEVFPHVSAATEAQRMAEAVWRVLVGDAQRSAQLMLRRPDGTEFSAVLKRDSGPDGSYMRELAALGDNSVRRYPGSVVYVEVGQRIMANTEEVILTQLDANPKPEYVILDLRETKSGVFPHRVLQRLALFPLPRGAYHELNWQSITSPIDPSVLTQEARWRSVPAHIIEPEAEPYRGHVVALISAETAGPAEQFLEPLVFADRVVLIGDTTAGAGSEIIELALNRGAKLSLAVRQPDWEFGYGNARGFPPRIYVEPTAKGLAAGKDEVLDRALSYINERAN